MRKYILMLSGVFMFNVVSLAAADSVMPAPKVTQFQSVSGAAPVAVAKPDEIDNLPPVTDVHNATSDHVPAAAPVTVTSNTSNDANASPVIDTSGETVHAELGILQKQVNNLIQRNSSDNIASIQEQLEKLNGKLAEEQNNLVNLQKKQNQFYQNLDQRIDVLEQMNAKSGVADVAKAKPAPVTAATATATAATAPVTAATAPVTAATAPAAAATAPVKKVSDNQAYQAAFSLVSENKYDQAQTALQAYISNYPQGEFQWDARYWSGEIYFLRKNYTQAEKMFNTVLTNGTDKSRLSVCQLRLAKIYLSTNREAQAKKILIMIKDKYPNTNEARLASTYLKEIQV